VKLWSLPNQQLAATVSQFHSPVSAKRKTSL
jgi:hypothetical protein